MSHIDRTAVEKIANLAHLKLSEEEIVHYQAQFDRILSYMDILQSFDDGLPLDWRPELQLPPSFEREDISESSQAIEKVLGSAPKVVGTAFQVPRIIE